MSESGLMRYGTAEPVSRGQILRRQRGQEKKDPCSVDHEQDGQPYRVDPYRYSAESADHTRFSLSMENEQADAGRDD